MSELGTAEKKILSGIDGIMVITLPFVILSFAAAGHPVAAFGGTLLLLTRLLDAWRKRTLGTNIEWRRLTRNLFGLTFAGGLAVIFVVGYCFLPRTDNYVLAMLGALLLAMTGALTVWQMRQRQAVKGETTP